MKFTPDHRPITMTGVASLAGLAVIAVLFFMTSSLTTGPNALQPAERGGTVDSMALHSTVPGPRDSASASDPATLIRLPGLTESVRASLLAAVAAAPQGTPDHGGGTRHPGTGSQPGGLLTHSQPGAQHVPPGQGNAHTAPPRRPTGVVTMGSMQWIGGGKRKKISGALPGWPAGVTGEAHIKVEAVIAPDGRVRSVRPGQKGNARCEDAAVRAVERWRFERLSRHIPQRDQRCVVTFSFTGK